jgi:RNA polymerase sigma-70 factor (ECF subfamily)
MRPEIEQAVRLLRSGDEKNIEQALTLLQNTLFSFSMRVCGQREDAEDTMQEVLLKALPYLPKFDKPKALLVWMYKVAKNRCLMSRRRSKFAPAQELSLDELMPDRRELDQLTNFGINPEMFAIRGEQVELLRKAIQKLPAQYRIVLVLRDMEGLRDDEVAEITGIRAGTVRVRLHRARLFVRKELTKMLASLHPAKLEPTRVSESGSPRPRRCKALFAELSNYLDETLDDSMCDRLEKHLEGCAPCQTFLKTLESTIAACREMPEPHPDPRKVAMVRDEFKARYRSLKKAIAQ